MINKFGSLVYAFDPTPESANWLSRQRLPGQFEFHPAGLASFDGQGEFYLPQDSRTVSHSIDQQSYVGTSSIHVPVQRISTIMKLLGHTRIDMLKTNIEGAEYSVLNDILESEIMVRQVLVDGQS